jgi:PAS domain S-box-containing protein
MATATAFIALLPLVGYAYGTRELYGIASATLTALPTAVNLEALALGLLMLTADVGIVSTLRASGTAGRLARRSLAYSIVVPLVVGWAVTRGLRLHLYGWEFAISCVVLGLILAMTFLISRDATQVGGLEAQRLAAVAELERSRQALAVASEREKVLRDAGETIRGLIDSTPDPMVVHRDGRIVRVNQSFADWLGYQRPEELVGLDPLQLVREPDRLRSLVAAGAAGAPVQRVLLRRDGTEVVGEFVDSRIMYQGEPAIVAAGRDVTERLRTEEALRRAEEQLRLTIESAPIGMALVALDGRWLSVNRALCEILGYSQEELLALTPQAVTPPDDLAAEQALLGRLLSGELARYSLAKRYLRKGGEPVDAMVHVSLLHDQEGRPRNLIEQVEDVTERKRIEVQLALRDRMASLGTMSAGVAHEINNPLSYVKTNLDLAADQLRSPEALARHGLGELAEMIDEARQGTERARRIVRGLKSFSRGDEERRAVLDVRRVIDLTIDMVFNEIRHRARLVKDFGEVPPVEADESRLAQVFTNLLVNAAQAIPEGHAERNEIRVVTRRDEQGRAVIEVRDTGSGIAEDHLQRIFEPFFTTKPIGVGTGLGLSVCHGIVTGLGGEIVAESVVGKGATLRVVLPAARAQAQPPPAAATEPGRPAAAQRARVLVVDDERLVGESLRRALAREHDVTVLASGQEALAAILGGARFDVIFCDLMMPAMTGMELHARLAEAAADQVSRMVFITGGAFTPAARAFLDEVSNERIEKPFEVQNVRAVVRRFQAIREPGAP